LDIEDHEGSQDEAPPPPPVGVDDPGPDAADRRRLPSLEQFWRSMDG